MTITYRVNPGGYLQGSIRVPGDKSISHRTLMLGAIAEGTTHVEGFLEGADCLATRQALRELGVVISMPQAGHVTIEGVGLRGFTAPKHILDLGNSGTSIRLLTGLLAGQSFSSELTGDASLQRRPMGRVVNPLRQMGAQIELQENGCPPLKITGQKLQPLTYSLPIASAQVKSALLLAGLYAQGTTAITEPAITRDHTERLLQAFAYPLQRTNNVIQIEGGQRLQATHIQVPADISSAAFFLVGASIAPKSDLYLQQVGVNPTRTGVLEILRRMGAHLELEQQQVVSGEPIANIRVRSSRLRGINIPAELVPLAIDEFPALFIAAACAEGTTVLTGAEELRVKESDRIQTMIDGLCALGIKAEATADGAVIEGGQLTGGSIDSHGDHRVAMAFAVAALRTEGPIVIKDCANVATSFPNFMTLAQQAGLDISLA